MTKQYEFYDLDELDNRQRVELAAAYLNLPVDGWTHNKYNVMRVVFRSREYAYAWNPMINNSDAFYLAFHLDMETTLKPGEPSGNYQIYEANVLRYREGPPMDIFAKERRRVVDRAAQLMLEKIKSEGALAREAEAQNNAQFMLPLEVKAA